MTTTPADGDINAVIVAAVNARIEAAVAQAMVTDEGIRPLVTAAMMQEIEVKDGSSYRTKKVPFLSEILRQTIQKATVEAVERVAKEHADDIEAKVREALTSGIDQFAKGITESFVKQATSGYGVRVSIQYPGMDSEF